MHFVALSIFTLGLLGAAAQTPTMKGNNGSITAPPNTTQSNSTMTPWNTTSVNSTTYVNQTPAPNATDPALLTTTPTSKPKTKTTTTTTTTTKDKGKDAKPRSDGRADLTGFIIIGLIMALGLLVAVICFIRRQRSRRFSADLRTPASVPLSVIVDPNEPDNSHAHNGIEAAAKEQVDPKESQDSPKDGAPHPQDSGPTEVPQAQDSSPTEVPQAQDSSPTEVPQPQESSPTEVPQPQDSSPTEVPQPKDSGPTETPPPMPEPDDQAVDVTTTTHLMDDAASDDKDVAASPEPGATASTESPAPSEAAATDSLIEK